MKIRFGDGLGSGQQRVFKIVSRLEPPKWPETDEVAVGDLKIDGAEKVNGYLALQPEQMFRLETTGVEGLEKRDPRTTPVKGDFAWFRRDAFQLRVKISQRAPEVQATLLGYALPVDGALDVNGQLGFNILYSGVNKLRIKVPADSAEQFYFDGDQIAERNRDGDTWTIVLQKEITGFYALKFHAVIPFDESQANFHVDVPDVQPLDVKQQAGTWAIEANTTTEISFKPTGMNELDPLHAPALPDYQPRHHVIGVYAYLGGQHSLKLDGVKHESAPILTAVADSLDLDTVVSTSGAERHSAVFNIRTVDDQFLDVALPEGSNIWSLVVDGQPEKPVAEKPDVVRVQLPATLDRTRDTAIQLVYETRRGEWKGSGGYKLVAPRLDDRIPVLQSNWKVWLPDGFSYTAFDSNLQKHDTPDTTPLLLAPFKWFKNSLLFRPRFAGASYSKNDIGRLMAEGDAFYSSARFDLAYKRYDQVLDLDPGNEAARRKQEQVLAARSRYADEAYNETRSQLNFGVTKDWETAPRKYTDREAVTFSGSISPAQANADYIQNKLNSIVIPVLELREATVRDAMEFLHQKSVELDTTEPDPSRKGVNIVLKLDNASAIADKRITLSLKNIPLGEAVRYISELAGLKYKVEPYALKIVPISESTETLVTKEYQLPDGFLSSGSTTNITANAAIAARPSAQEYLQQSGVQFPEGASASFLPGSNKLVVRNTEEQLDLVDAITDALGNATPGQAGEKLGDSNGISVESKFVGVDKAAAGDLSFEYRSGQSTAGLLPMKLDLDHTGREYSFDGFYAAERVSFHYLDWWGEARRAWIWWLAGMLLFLAWGAARPWRRLLWGALALTFIPVCLAQSLTGMCNSLLVGWFMGFAVYQIATRLVFRRRRVMEAATV